MGRYKNPNCFPRLLGIITAQCGIFSHNKKDLVLNIITCAGKKGFEGIEGSGEDSSSCSGETGEEAGCGDIEVHAGLGSCSGPS